MSLDHGIRIDLHRPKTGPRRVVLRSGRPTGAGRILTGMTPGEALRTVPILFSICALAQATTAARAVEQALRRPAPPRTEAARDLLVLAEMLREHATRALVDWPRHQGQAPRWESAYPVHRFVSNLQQALFADRDPFGLPAPDVQPTAAALTAIASLENPLREAVFGESIRDFQARVSVSAIRDWAEAMETPAAGLLAEISRRGWSAAGAADLPTLPAEFGPELTEDLFGPNADRFLARPVWNGAPAETTAYSRHQDHDLIRDARRSFRSGLLTRVAARLVELAGLPEQLHHAWQRLVDGAESASPPASLARGFGLAQVETARGRLIHAAHVVDGRLQFLRILAPTEWNFHPEGVVVQGLAALVDEPIAELRAQGSNFIEAIDPCTQYHLRVNDA